MNLADELVFLTMNEDLDLGPMTVEKGEDLPLLKGALVQGVRDKSFKEAIPFTEFLKGMALCFYVNKDLALDKNYDKILLESPYRANLIKDIMLNVKDQEIKVALLTSLKDLGIQEEEVDYLLATLKEEDLRGSNLIGQALDEAVLPLIKAYSRVGKDSPFYPHALLHLAGLYAATGRYIKARHYTNEVLRLKTSEEMKTKARQALEELEDYANLEAVQSYLHVNDYERAQDHLDKISSDYPNPDHLAFFQGTLRLAKEDYEGAITYLKKALKAQESPAYYERLGLAYIGSGQVDKAIQAYEKALETGFDPYTIHHNLSYLYGPGQLDQAIYHGQAAYNLKNTEEMEDWLKELENRKKVLDNK